MKKLPVLICTGSLLLGSLLLRAENQPPPPADPFVKSAEAPAGNAAKPNAQPVVLPGLLVLEVYSLDKNTALDVLESESGHAARYRRVTELAKKGKARLRILTAVANKSGNKEIIEATDEVRYGTEFDPAQGDTPAQGTAFETRNAGQTLQFQSTLAPDGRSVELEIINANVSLTGFRTVSSNGADSALAQPLFASQKISTSLVLPTNAPGYLGSFTPAVGSGGIGISPEIWLAFVRTNVITPGATEIKPPAKPLDWSTVTLEYSFYSMDRAAARDILVAAPALTTPWKSVQALVSQGNATFEDLVSIQGRSGTKFVVEEILEVRYLTEFGSAKSVAGPEPAVEPEAEPEEEKSQTPDAPCAVPAAAGRATIPLPLTPISFETRNAGITIEAEPVLGDNNLTIELNHILQSVAHRGNMKTPDSDAGGALQPLFETRKISTEMTLYAGIKTLVGTFNPPENDGVNGRGDSGRTWLVFVRATSNEP